jgi:hypothetical protein
LLQVFEAGINYLARIFEAVPKMWMRWRLDGFRYLRLAYGSCFLSVDEVEAGLSK